MTRTQQRNFVTSLSDDVRDSIVKAIENGDVPAEWDGHELRALIADRAASHATVSTIRKNPRHARAKAYKNTILTVPNLLP